MILHYIIRLLQHINNFKKLSISMIKSKFLVKKDYQVIKLWIIFNKISKIKSYNQNKKLKTIQNILMNMILKMINKEKKLFNLIYTDNFNLF